MEPTTQQGRREAITVTTRLQPGPNRQIIAKVRDHEICMDIRKEWGGDNAGPTPPECMLIGLGGCIISAYL
jgi:uncharacterized OsmC-like protein